MGSNLQTTITFIALFCIPDKHPLKPSCVREGAQYRSTHLLLYEVQEPWRKHVAAVHLPPYLRIMNLVLQRLIQRVLSVRILHIETTY
jgi:hypothetical protein